LATRSGRLVLGLPKNVFDLLAFVALALGLSLHRGQRSLYPQWLQPIQRFLGDMTVNAHSAKPDAVVYGFRAKGSAADIALRVAALACVLDVQSSAAAGASEQSRQQSFAAPYGA
jgi:hypothetical protein